MRTLSSRGPVSGHDRNRIDLQIHSVESDGNWTYETLSTAVSEVGLRYASMTEHDLLTPQSDLDDLSRNTGCDFIPGVEVTCTHAGRYMDLLCYGATAEAPALARLSTQLWERQIDNAIRVREALGARGHLSDQHDLSDQALRTHSTAQIPFRLRDALRAGTGKNPKKLALMKRHGYRLQAHDLRIAASACRSDGWVCLLAHPSAHKPGHPPMTLADIATLLADIGFDGLEVYSPSHTAKEQAALARFCEENNVLCGAGSDSHGPQDDLGTWSATNCTALLRRLGRV